MHGITPAGRPRTTLDIEVVGDTDRRDIALRGDLDICTVDQLRSALHECAALGTRLVVLDLTAVGFLAVAGLHVFVDAHEVLHTCGARLVLTGASPMARRVLRITELDLVLNIDLDPQLAGSPRAPHDPRTW